MSFRVAFLIGEDNEATRNSISAVCAITGIEPVGVLLDTHRPSYRQRWRNLRRNIAREGLSYPFRRLARTILARLEARAVDVFVDRSETDQLLRLAFPDRYWRMEELVQRHNMPLLRVGHLNQAPAVEALKNLRADLGIVLGTRILKPVLFSAPRLGSINLHKGRLPDYRGMPPGFWELFHGETRAGATVHFVDAGLDEGAIVAEDTIPISALETPETLRVKLNWLGSSVLAEAVTALAQGQAVPRPQTVTTHRPHTRPTEAEQRQLSRRLPHWRRKNTPLEIAKHLLYFGIYYSGLIALKRALRRPDRAAILLYHRVNDWSIDPLTTSERRFAEHLVFLKRRYPVVSTGELLDAHDRGTIPHHSSVIHFDDCYRDVATAAGPLLRQAGVCATAFISTGFIGTDRIFDHDRRKYPHRYPNLSAEDLRKWRESGLEVAAHTVNHVDLGSIPLADARHEVAASGRHLCELLNEPISCFSFPFGGRRNIRPEVVEQVREAGYRALFSAHGGFVVPSCDRFDLPRLGVHEQSPLYLQMEMEGLALAQWKQLFLRWRSGS
jgi:folate-dependent phosphoribosylglycinamide formyltransferase PurN/peptidoglycan/xylan/chitin deacetylase (PgdA/CDA1 family)